MKNTCLMSKNLHRNSQFERSAVEEGLKNRIPDKFFIGILNIQNKFEKYLMN